VYLQVSGRIVALIISKKIFRGDLISLYDSHITTRDQTFSVKFGRVWTRAATG
jgi:hypothetical protein